MKKKFFPKLIIGFCIVSILCTGCHSDQNRSTLESYDGKEQVSEEKEESRKEYEYLAKTTVKNGEAEVRLFIPADPSQTATSQSKGSLHGVTVDNELIKTTKTPKDISKEEIKGIKKALSSQKKIQNIASDKGSGSDDFYLYSLSYDIAKKDVVYPCIEMVKTEKVTSEYVLKTRITVDNQYTDKDTNNLLMELSAAYGINLKKN